MKLRILLAALLLGSIVAMSGAVLADPSDFLAGTEVLDHAMCKGVENNQCVGRTTAFSPTEARAYNWVSMRNASVGDSYKWEFFGPDGSLYTTITGTSERSGYRNFWAYIMISSWPPASMPGQWRAKFYYKGVLQYTDTFTIAGGAEDSDYDGLTDDEERLYGTNPHDARDPGIWVKYDPSYKTRDYFCWEKHGNQYIAFDAVVVRRGTTLKLGFPEVIEGVGVGIIIDKSDPTLTDLEAGRSVRVGPTNTVGKYVTDVGCAAPGGVWSKQMDLYVIFDLPAPNSHDDTNLEDDYYVDAEHLTPKGIKAYLYDEGSQKDDISVMWFASSDDSIGKSTDFHWDYGERCKGNGYFWHSLFSAGRFDNKQYTKHVLVDHVMKAINGQANQWNAAIAIQNYISPLKAFAYPDPYFDMFGGIYSDWLDGNSIYGNPGSECSAFAAATCSFLRSAGIPARVVVVDHHAPGGQPMNYDHATELWVSDPSNPGAQWYVMLGRSAGAGIETRPEPPGWPSSKGDRLMVTAGPDFVITDLDKARGVSGRMVWLTNPAEGSDNVSDGWWDHHHWYQDEGSDPDGTDPGWLARKAWVITENKVYWGTNDPTTVDGCIWPAEPAPTPEDHGNTPGSARQLVPGGPPVQGIIDYNCDEDWFVFHAVEETYIIEVSWLTSALIWPRFEVYDESENKVAESQGDFPGQAAWGEFSIFEPCKNYYVRVTDVNHQGGPQYGYQLYVGAP